MDQGRKLFTGRMCVCLCAAVEEALAHPYMASLHDEADEPSCHTPFTFDSEHPIVTNEDARRFIHQEAIAIGKQRALELGA